jgi:hypothetical protein
MSSTTVGNISVRTTPSQLANHLHSLQASHMMPRTRSSSPGPMERQASAANFSAAAINAGTPSSSQGDSYGHKRVSGSEADNRAYADDSVRGNPLRLDDAINTAVRARDESEHVMAEVLAGIERSFQPNDDKRLVCRAYVVQLGRTGGRLREATQRLEKEAADALRVAHNENNALLSKLNHLQTQSGSQTRLLQQEVERSEHERSQHGMHMHREFERLRQEREDESGRLRSEVARLSASLEQSRLETSALWSQAQQQQRILTNDNESLRSEVVRLTQALEASRDAHGIDGTTLRAELTLLGAEKAASTNRLRSDLAYMTQLASETQARLEAELVMARVDRESAVEALRGEMHQMMVRHTAEVERLQEALRAAEFDKEKSEFDLRGMLRRQRQEHHHEAGSLKSKVERLEAVHKEAMEAGTLKARQILYWETVKGEGKGSPSMTWRATDEKLPATPGADDRTGSPERRYSPERYDALGNERGRPTSPERRLGGGGHDGRSTGVPGPPESPG